MYIHSILIIGLSEIRLWGPIPWFSSVRYQLHSLMFEHFVKCWVSNDDRVIGGKCYYSFRALFAVLSSQSLCIFYHKSAVSRTYNKKPQISLASSTKGNRERLLSSSHCASQEQAPLVLLWPYVVVVNPNHSCTSDFSNVPVGMHCIIDSSLVLKCWPSYKKNTLP